MVQWHGSQPQHQLQQQYLQAWSLGRIAHYLGVELRANRESISHIFHFFKVAFVWELTKETIHLPLGCLQGGRLTE